MGRLFLLLFCFLIHLQIFAKDLIQKSDSKQKNVNLIESNSGQTNETNNLTESNSGQTNETNNGAPMKVNLTEINKTLYERKPSSSCVKSLSQNKSGKLKI